MQQNFSSLSKVVSLIEWIWFSYLFYSCNQGCLIASVAVNLLSIEGSSIFFIRSNEPGLEFFKHAILKSNPFDVTIIASISPVVRPGNGDYPLNNI